MKDFPIPRILEFVLTVPPFDHLNKEELSRLVSLMEIAYYPQGEVLMRRGGGLPDYVHIIQKGSVRLTLIDDWGKEILVDERAEGEVIGAASLVQGPPALFDVTAQEDIVAYLLPAVAFKEIASSNPFFERYFSASLTRVFKTARQLIEKQPVPLIGETASDADTLLLSKKVSDLMITDILTCRPVISIRTAAQKMAERRVGSILITDETGCLLGIVTDADLRSRVLAPGHDVEAPVEAVMSKKVCTITQETYAFDALLEMSRPGVRHLVVKENDHLVGIITDHDFHMATGSAPLRLIRNIESARSVEELVSLRPKIDRMLVMLLRHGGSVKNMMELVTQFNDRVTLRLLKLTEDGFVKEGLGGPSVSYCWIALGSEGRREQTLRTDQDNALFFTDVPAEQENEVKRWFLMFSQRVMEGLVLYGFPRCRGEVMASNPKCCQTESQWRQTFLSWINGFPELFTLMLTNIFFDFRPLYAESNFPYILRDTIHGAIQGNSHFLRSMARNSLHNRPPLGFLRKFVVEKTGEHKDELDLKHKGLMPVVDSARVLALDLKIMTTNTLERLEGAQVLGILDREFLEDIKEAYSFINRLRITQHLEALAGGKEPSNFVNPETLNSLQRKLLKESFAVINRLQEMVTLRYLA